MLSFQPSSRKSTVLTTKTYNATFILQKDGTDQTTVFNIFYSDRWEMRSSPIMTFTREGSCEVQNEKVVFLRSVVQFSSFFFGSSAPVKAKLQRAREKSSFIFGQVSASLTYCDTHCFYNPTWDVGLHSWAVRNAQQLNAINPCTVTCTIHWRDYPTPSVYSVYCLVKWIKWPFFQSEADVWN